jgi:hypothetical protein
MSEPQLSVVRETEKALQVEASVYVEFAPIGGFTASMIKDRTYNMKIWIPKSQIKDGKPSERIKSIKENDLMEDSWLNSRIMNGRVIRVSITFKYK